MPKWLLNSQVENEQTLIPNFLFYVDIAMTNTKNNQNEQQPGQTNHKQPLITLIRTAKLYIYTHN